jgi:hypothetical protein
MAPMKKVGGPEDLKGAVALFATEACASSPARRSPSTAA